MKYVSVLVLFLMATTSSSDETPDRIVKNYLQGYSDGIDTVELVKAYWMPSMSTFSAGRQASHMSSLDFAKLVDSFRENERSKGWIRTSIIESAMCVLREDMAFVHVRYQREYKDGSMLEDAVLYTVNKEIDWRISSVIPTVTNILVECTEPRERKDDV